jgi:hypothetical protein
MNDEQDLIYVTTTADGTTINFSPEQIKERASWTAGHKALEVRRLMMERGIVAPKNPTFEALAPEPKLPTPIGTVYTLGDVRTGSTDRNAVLEAAKNLRTFDYEYADGYMLYPTAGNNPLPVQTAPLYSKSDVHVYIRSKRDWDAQSKERTAIQEDYDNALVDVKNIQGEVDLICILCRSIAQDAEGVFERFKEYLSLCNENRTIALNFLRKVSSQSDIEKAEQILGTLLSDV